MTQQATVDDGSAPTYRQLHRERRHREFIVTAMTIVTTRGVDALTMKAVTDELECSEGSIYQYFPTKGALVAEVQAEAMQSLGGSLLLSQAAVINEVAVRELDERVMTLARAMAAARFWVTAEDVFPQEVLLTRSLFTAPEEVFSLEDGETAAQVGTQLLEFGWSLFDAAVEAGALRTGDNFERTVVVLAATTGVLMAGGMARWDERVAEPRSAALALLTGQFLYWGAEPDELATVETMLDEMSAEGSLVPPVAN